MPFTPPLVSFIGTLVTTLQSIELEVQAQTAALTSLEATVAAQAAEIAVLKNFFQYHLESIYGSNPDIDGIAAGGPP